MNSKFIENLTEALEIEDDRTISLTDKFKEFPEWDSLSRLSLIAMLDEEYDIQIEEEEFAEINTIQDLVDRVESK